MKLNQATSEYIAHKRALGMRFITEESCFKTYTRAVGDLELDDINADAVRGFLAAKKPKTRANYHGALEGFYRFAILRGYSRSSPLPQSAPKMSRTFRPHIYSSDEIQRLLAATQVLDVPHTPLRSHTYRTLILLLYGTGLRIGEALRLTFTDVDLREQILSVRFSKFFKDRYVPFGSRLAQILRDHHMRRQRLPMLSGERSPFFCLEMKHRRGQAMKVASTDLAFRRVVVASGVRTSVGTMPRLHDMRHTFAIRRLVAWYRSGADVQRMLPLLSTYLGHISIVSTQCYLMMTPDLLNEASHRFADFAHADRFA